MSDSTQRRRQVDDRLPAFNASKVNVEVIWTASQLVAETLKDAPTGQQQVVESRLRTLNYHYGGDEPHSWSLLFQELCVAVCDPPTSYAHLPPPLLALLRDHARARLDAALARDPTTRLPSALDTACRYGRSEGDGGGDSLPRPIAFSRAADDASRLDNNSLVDICRLTRSLAKLEAKCCESDEGEEEEERMRWIVDRPLLLHDVKYEEEDELGSLSRKLTRQLLDNLMVALNWHRELLSIFAASSSSNHVTAMLLRRVCAMQRGVSSVVGRSRYVYQPAPIDETNHYPTGQKCSTITRSVRHTLICFGIKRFAKYTVCF